MTDQRGTEGEGPGRRRVPERSEADLSPEERRLMEYLDGKSTPRQGDRPAGGPSVRGRAPDAPTRRSRQEEERRGRVVKVTGAIVLVLVFAEVTGTLIGNAWLLAIVAALAGLSYDTGFVQSAKSFADVPDGSSGSGIVSAMHRYYRTRARRGFVAMLLLFAVTAYFGWREHHTIAELASIITPVPEITDVTYVPTRGEQAGIAALTSGLEGVGGETGVDARASSRDAAPAGASEAAETRYWDVTTKLDTAAVMEFYTRPGNLGDWAVVEEAKGVRRLQRGSERMLIVVRDDWPRPRFIVSYIYHTE